MSALVFIPRSAPKFIIFQSNTAPSSRRLPVYITFGNRPVAKLLQHANREHAAKSRASFKLFPRVARVPCFPARLTLVAHFPALFTNCRYSRDFRAPECSTALHIGYVFSRARHRLHVNLRSLPVAFCRFEF